jgi:hypothetical protein
MAEREGYLAAKRAAGSKGGNRSATTRKAKHGTAQPQTRDRSSASASPEAELRESRTSSVLRSPSSVLASLGDGDGREGVDAAPSRRDRVIAELETAVARIVEQARVEAPERGLTAGELFERASAIAPGNGRTARSFTSPRSPGLPLAWLETTLRKLPDVRAELSRELSGPRM